jgi:hypothetical protein
MESFLSRLMDKNVIPDDIMDEEYYLFSGEGTSVSLLNGPAS